MSLLKNEKPTCTFPFFENKQSYVGLRLILGSKRKSTVSRHAAALSSSKLQRWCLVTCVQEDTLCTLVTIHVLLLNRFWAWLALRVRVFCLRVSVLSVQATDPSGQTFHCYCTLADEFSQLLNECYVILPTMFFVNHMLMHSYRGEPLCFKV